MGLVDCTYWDENVQWCAVELLGSLEAAAAGGLLLLEVAGCALCGGEGVHVADLETGDLGVGGEIPVMGDDAARVRGECTHHDPRVLEVGDAVSHDETVAHVLVIGPGNIRVSPGVRDVRLENVDEVLGLIRSHTRVRIHAQLMTERVPDVGVDDKLSVLTVERLPYRFRGGWSIRCAQRGHTGLVRVGKSSQVASGSVPDTHIKQGNSLIHGASLWRVTPPTVSATEVQESTWGVSRRWGRALCWAGGSMSETNTPTNPSVAPLGTVYLPASGTSVGQFQFIVDPEHGGGVEIGTPVAAATAEGSVVGVVVDLHTVGVGRDPVRDELGARYDEAYIAAIPEVMVATVQVYASPAMRPVRAGVVRPATAEQLLDATGISRIEWPIPAGVLPLADGSWAKVCMDGKALLGPESAHLIVNGLSGQAAKTSYAGVLLKAAIAAGDEINSVAAIIFNVKGDDLVYLDQAPTSGYELSDDDRAMYEALGVPATPFADVQVWAPALPGGEHTGSRRDDVEVLRWDLASMWPYLHHIVGVHDDEKVASFFAEFAEAHVYTRNPSARIDTFDKLDAWFDTQFSDAADRQDMYGWRSHHIATMRRIRRMIMGLVPRCGGLLARGSAKPSMDIPVNEFRHGRVVVVDIAGLQPDVQSIVIARTLDRIMKEAEAGYIGVEHLVVFADELNAFAPAQGGELKAVKKILQRISTQGRYAGISLWGACQKMSKIDELVRDNAATRALGITPDGELASGVYGRLPGGLAERIATLPKGQIALYHYTFRGAMVVRFPRPAWRTGKSKSVGRRTGATDVLGLSDRARDRLFEGLDKDSVERIIAESDDATAAVGELQRQRRPDMSKTALHEPSRFDIEDPFGLGT